MFATTRSVVAFSIFYVVDEEDCLIGVIPTRRLLRARRQDKVSEVMIRPVISIPQAATVLDACEFFAIHKLFAFPVVDAEGKLVQCDWGRHRGCHRRCV
jgi:magnesium transporter